MFHELYILFLEAIYKSIAET